MDFPSLLIDTLRLGDVPSETLMAQWAAPMDTACEELVRSEGVGTWLYRRWREAPGAQSPNRPFDSRIRTQAVTETATALRVESAAGEALGILRNAGFEAVLLKGLAYRAASPSYPYLDARSTIDIDLLIAPGEGERAWTALRNAGFTPTPPPDFPKPPDHHHLDGLWSDRRVVVELHTSTSSARTPDEAWRRMRGSAEVREWNGIQVLVPSATELLWHAVEHSFTHGAAGFSLRQILPGTALLAAKSGIDLDLIHRRTATERLREGSERRAATSRSLTRWFAMAASLAGPVQVPSDWQRGSDRLWRLLSWRLKLLREPSSARRLRPYLAEQGTRAELGLRWKSDSSESSMSYGARYVALASLSRLAYVLSGARRRP
jgi:putative nucleotidyltransferase-like protein